MCGRQLAEQVALRVPYKRRTGGVRRRQRAPSPRIIDQRRTPPTPRSDRPAERLQRVGGRPDVTVGADSESLELLISR
jgi:hypothetical protein